MTPPIGTGGAAAAGVIDALKGQPLVLALIVIAFGLVGLLYYQSALFNTQRQENVKLFLEVQKEVQKLLSQCIVPAPPSSRTSAEAPSFPKLRVARSPRQELTIMQQNPKPGEQPKPDPNKPTPAEPKPGDNSPVT